MHEQGATLTHLNILNNGFFAGERMGLTPDDTLCVPVPLYHCFGLVLGKAAEARSSPASWHCLLTGLWGLTSREFGRIHARGEGSVSVALLRSSQGAGSRARGKVHRPARSADKYVVKPPEAFL